MSSLPRKQFAGISAAYCRNCHCRQLTNMGSSPLKCGCRKERSKLVGKVEKKVYDEQELEVDGKHGGIYSMLEGA